jgi:uncharacterized protein (TIGR00369 family)
VTGFGDRGLRPQVATFLGLSMRETGAVREGGAELRGTVPVGDHLRNRDGSLAGGVLAGLVDSVGGLCGGLASLPGWVVSTNLMLRVLGRDAVGPLHVDGEVWRAGRNAAVAGVRIADARGPVATGALTSAVLVPAGGPPVFPRPVELVVPPAPEPPGLTEFVATTAVDDATLRLELTDALRNPWGILHGAVTAMLADLAGLHAARGVATTDLVLHFLSPARVGPVEARAVVVGQRGDGALLRIELLDRGVEDRVVAVAVSTVR